MTAGWMADLLDLDVSGMPILGDPLGSWQLATRRCGAGRAGEVVHSGSNVFANEAFVRSMSLLAEAVSGPVSAAVRVGPAHAEFGGNRSACRDGELLHHDLTIGRPGEPATPVVVPHLEQALERHQPGRMAQPILVPQGREVIWTIDTWADLLAANLLALQAATGAIDANKIDSSSNVHPTAVVERSEIGRGVSIGPHAVVVDSIVSADCEIQDHASVNGSQLDCGTTVQTGALVHGSVVGDTTVVSFHTAVRGSVLLGASTISCPVVARSLIGREVFLARGVTIGASLLADRPVKIRVGRRSVSSGMKLLGCVVGTGSRIGNGIDLPAGYEVPAGVTIAHRPLARISADVDRGSALTLVDKRFRQFGLGSEGGR